MQSIGLRRASQSLLGKLSQCPRFSHHSPRVFSLSRLGRSYQTPHSQSLRIPFRCNSTQAPSQHDFNSCVQEVQAAVSNPYPRLESNANRLGIKEFCRRYDHLEPNQLVEEDEVVVQGRIRTYRLAGSKLIFFDIVQHDHKLQAMCNLRLLADVTPEKFKQFYRLLRRGDAFSVTGKPHRTGRGELTVQVTELPTLLSPSLHDIPTDTKEHGISAYPRHVQLLADKPTSDILRIRSTIIQYIRQYFVDRAFMEVNTPVIAGEAGGATARPFVTTANEFPDKQLYLRIAPELWLKKLVIGGFDKVFEIGPSFRNEGIDKSHNPEFTTCEFYMSYANLEDVISMTEDLFAGLAEHVSQYKESIKSELPNPRLNLSTPFRRIDFIPGIEAAIGRPLPDLSLPSAEADVQKLFEDLSIPLPELPTLPRLMDKLCSTYLEPQCHEPTFIIHPPECLSPLSKSFMHNNERVAARCELFIEGREYVNAYEEENSPWEQRRKFEQQVVFNQHTHESTGVDENYLQAMEWGLPPTGGWGCGIDRLVMLFTDSKRISDVLPFRSLRSISGPGNWTFNDRRSSHHSYRSAQDTKTMENGQQQRTVDASSGCANEKVEVPSNPDVLYGTAIVYREHSTPMTCSWEQYILPLPASRQVPVHGHTFYTDYYPRQSASYLSQVTTPPFENIIPAHYSYLSPSVTSFESPLLENNISQSSLSGQTPYFDYRHLPLSHFETPHALPSPSINYIQQSRPKATRYQQPLGYPSETRNVTPIKPPASKTRKSSSKPHKEAYVEPVGNHDKPYAYLLYEALLSAKDHTLSLQEIYRWFKDNTKRKDGPNSEGWKSSIRHNLSMNDAFILLSETSTRKGKSKKKKVTGNSQTKPSTMV